MLVQNKLFDGSYPAIVRGESTLLVISHQRRY